MGAGFRAWLMLFLPFLHILKLPILIHQKLKHVQGVYKPGAWGLLGNLNHFQDAFKQTMNFPNAIFWLHGLMCLHQWCSMNFNKPSSYDDFPIPTPVYVCKASLSKASRTISARPPSPPICPPCIQQQLHHLQIAIVPSPNQSQTIRSINISSRRQ